MSVTGSPSDCNFSCVDMFFLHSLQALLHSMHKYFLRLLVDEERKPPPGESKVSPRSILQIDFPETNFIAVTAYQNEEVSEACAGLLTACAK